MDSGDCNRLRTLVCVTVDCKLWKCNNVIVVCSTTRKWSINPIIQNPVYSHIPLNRDITFRDMLFLNTTPVFNCQ
jgi:hypothetical protein